MANLIEMAADIVAAHASNSPLSSAQLVEELQQVYAALKALDSGQTVEVAAEAPALTVKQAFKKDEVVCMVCGKGGMKTLKRHLSQAHGLKPGQYRKQFGIPSSQSLAAKSYSESRRKMAEERGLADKLAKARAIRGANLQKKKVAAKPVKTVKTAAKAKARKA
jgi:predicted transcriptional regulator